MNPLLLDPQRIGPIRKAFLRELSSGFNLLSKQVIQLVKEEDAFGLNPTPGIFNTRWKFSSSDEKMRNFMQWFQAALDAGVLRVEGDMPYQKPWIAKHVEKAYMRGAVRVYFDTNKLKAFQNRSLFDITQKEFLRQAFSSPEALARIKIVSTRAFDQLKGVTAQMSQNISRILADGLSRGSTANQIARTLSREIKDFDLARSKRLVTTELSHAYTEGQLDAMEALNIKKLSVMVEWVSGSGNPCPMCVEMIGTIFTVKDARGMIPRHPHCLCAFVPITETSEEKKYSKSLIEKAIIKSVRQELPKVKTIKQLKRKSRWTGAKWITRR